MGPLWGHIAAAAGDESTAGERRAFASPTIEGRRATPRRASRDDRRPTIGARGRTANVSTTDGRARRPTAIAAGCVELHVCGLGALLPAPVSGPRAGKPPPAPRPPGGRWRPPHTRPVFLFSGSTLPGPVFAQRQPPSSKGHGSDRSSAWQRAFPNFSTLYLRPRPRRAGRPIGGRHKRTSPGRRSGGR